jgi:phenylpyruvate tautomerase PptA (4-oxalocrotonate tautomerase family)
MPIVRIDILEGFSSNYKRSLLDSVHEALVYSFKIPGSDRNQTIREFSEQNFDRSEGKTKQFTMIEISAFAGRSREAKRTLYSRIVANLVKSPGISANDVLITLNEIELVNWGVQGGQVADEVDLGFQVKV